MQRLQLICIFTELTHLSSDTDHVLSEPQTDQDSPVLPKHYLEEVFNTFWIIAVTFPADSFHFFNLPCLARSLNILEVHIWILAEVYNRAQEIKQTLRENSQHVILLKHLSWINISF